MRIFLRDGGLNGDLQDGFQDIKIEIDLGGMVPG